MVIVIEHETITPLVYRNNFNMNMYMSKYSCSSPDVTYNMIDGIAYVKYMYCEDMISQIYEAYDKVTIGYTIAANGKIDGDINSYNKNKVLNGLRYSINNIYISTTKIVFCNHDNDLSCVYLCNK